MPGPVILSTSIEILHDRCLRNIAKAAQSAGYVGAPARLIAVSKEVEAARLREMLETTEHRLFGENYVQEAGAKWPTLRAAYPDIELHLIGHLQSNKADDAVELFDAIDSLDRIKLADALAKSMQKQNKRVPLLIEVNIGREPQKHGCLPDDVSALLAHARALGLDVQGLMCIPPAGVDPAPFFRELAQMARQLELPRISMGMSSDFKEAVKCGATEVRVGSALFGERPAKTQSGDFL